MKRIYLIRHGECEGKGTYIGRGSDVSLTNAGRQQITALAQSLKSRGVKPIRMITSGLIRAKESGILLAEEWGFEKSLIEDRRLDEIDFGEWEGLTYDQMIKYFPGESQKWFTDPWNQAPPKGECSRELAERVREFYSDFMKNLTEEEGEIFLISHGGPLRMLLCLIMGLEPEKQWSFKIERSGLAGIDFIEDTPVLFRLR